MPRHPAVAELFLVRRYGTISRMADAYLLDRVRGRQCFRVRSFRKPHCASVCSAFPKLDRRFLFFLGRFFALHLSHLLGKTGGVFLVLVIINGESPENIVRVVPGPLMIRISLL